MNELDTFIHYRTYLRNIFGNEPISFNGMASHVLSVVAMPEDELKSHDTAYLQFLHEWSGNIQGQLAARIHR